MFNFKDSVITKVFNPLNVTKSSMIEFNVGDLKDTGLYRFNLIVEYSAAGSEYSRYVIFSKSDDAEYVFEVFPGNEGTEAETYLYTLADTVPFSEEFQEVAGQLYLTTPDGVEYKRTTMPDCEDRLEGVSGKARVYNVESGKVEKEFGFKLWEYQRDAEGITEYLQVEMSEEDGMFRIFIGEMLEDVFYKFYQTSNE